MARGADGADAEEEADEAEKREATGSPAEFVLYCSTAEASFSQEDDVAVASAFVLVFRLLFSLLFLFRLTELTKQL